jgi:succinoglycan biosynthesis transport protein ExoP
MTTAPLPIRPSALANAPARPASATGGGAPATVTLDPVRILRKYKWLLIFAAGTGVALGVVSNEVLKRTNPVWRSTSTYQVFPPVRSVLEADSAATDREEFERFAMTESRVLTADRTLRDAVERNAQLREQTVWAQQFYKEDPSNGQKVMLISDAVNNLREMVSARSIAGTSLMELSVSGPIREDVAVIASAVHTSYFEDLRNRNRNAAGDRKGPLEAERSRLQTEMDTLARNEQEIIERNKITAIAEGSSGLLNREMMLNSSISEAEQRIQFAQTQMKRVEEQLKRDGGVAYSDEQRAQAERQPVIQSIKTRLNDLQAEDESFAQRGYGTNHKDRIALRTRVDAVKSQYDSELAKELEKIFLEDKDRTEQSLRQAQASLTEQTRQRDEVRLELQRSTAARARLDDIRNNKDINRRRLDEISSALREIQLLDELVRGERIGRIRRLEAPRTPDTLSFPRLTIMVPLGVALLVGLTGAGIVLREALDQRVRGPADIGVIPRIKLLGIIPLAGEDPTRPANVETAFRDAPTGAVSEGFRQLRANIVKRMNQIGAKSLMVISGNPGSGATTTATNLAMGFAASELRVLLIDANFRKPGLHKVLKLSEGPGLADVLARKSELKSAIQATAFPNLSLLSAGSGANRAVPERLPTDSMSQIIRESGESFDLIIIDVAPGVVSSDGVGLANRCDATLLVVRANGEKRGLVARLRDQLSDCKGELLGVVVNAVRANAGGYMRENIKTAYEYQVSSNS